MAITVRSPYSGDPVKVRDQDAGRAVKDGEGRLFYVLPRSDGSGYYGSMTRAPNTKDEARALELESKVALNRGQVEGEAQAVRDGPTGGRGKLILLIVLLLALVAAWLVSPWGPFPLIGRPSPAVPVPAPSVPVSFADPARGGGGQVTLWRSGYVVAFGLPGSTLRAAA